MPAASATEIFRARQHRDIPPQILETITADRDAEILAGHILQLMRFIEDYSMILGQDAAGVLFVLEREVGEEEVVVDDDDVALQRALVHERDEAALELLALLTAAKIAPRVQLGPGCTLLGQRLDLGAVAELGGLLPILNDLEIGELFEAGQDGLIVGVVDFLAAGVIAASLHQANLQRAIEMLLQKRDVFEEELLLEILGAGGYDDAPSGQNRRDQVGQGLAGSRAGFDDEMLAILERGLHGLGHFELPLPELVVRMPLGKSSVTGEEAAGAGRAGGCGHSGDTSILLSWVFNAVIEAVAHGSHRRQAERRKIHLVQSHHRQTPRHCGR